VRGLGSFKAIVSLIIKEVRRARRDPREAKKDGYSNTRQRQRRGKDPHHTRKEGGRYRPCRLPGCRPCRFLPLPSPVILAGFQVAGLAGSFPFLLL